MKLEIEKEFLILVTMIFKSFPGNIKNTLEGFLCTRWICKQKLLIKLRKKKFRERRRVNKCILRLFLNLDLKPLESNIAGNCSFCV